MPLTQDKLQELGNRMITGLAKVGNRQALGSLYRPRKSPTTGLYMENKPGSACAIGALALGYDHVISEMNLNVTSDFWPEGMVNPQAECPIDGQKGRLGQTIVHMNDQHRWPVADIATWLTDRDHRATEQVIDPDYGN